MLHKPINNIIKASYNKLLNEAKQRAEDAYYNNIVLKTEGLNNFKLLKLLDSELSKIKIIIDKSEYPFYIKNHNSDNWLLTQLASRHFLLEVDDTHEFINAVYLGHYERKLFNDIDDIVKEIPKYSLADFMDGKVCDYYLNFDKYYNIDKEEYHSILEWQTENLIKVVSYDTINTINRIQKYCKTITTPLEYINGEYKLLNNSLLEAHVKNAKELKETLKKSTILSGLNLESFDDALLYENYEILYSNRIDFKKVSLKTIGNLIEEIGKKPNRLISNEYTLFYTINNLLFWFEDIIEGQSIYKHFEYPDYNLELENLISNVVSKANDYEITIDNYAYDENKDKEDIKSYLLEQFDIYRNKFNNYESKNYFYLIVKENRRALLGTLKVNSFFGNEFEQHIKLIKEALIIQEFCWKIVQTYCGVFDTHRLDFPDNDVSYTEIMFLMHQMVLDKELYNDLEETLDNFMMQFHNFRLPMDVFFQNQRDKFTNLYRKCIDRLQNTLDDSEPNKKVLYVQSRLKELRHREARLDAYIKEDKDLGKKEFKYSTLFREFLEIEAEFIKDTSQANGDFSLQIETSETLLINTHNDELLSLTTEEKTKYIYSMLEDLSITNEGQSILSMRKKGAIRGVTEALRECSILPNVSLDKLYKTLGKEIGLKIKSKLDVSNVSEEFRKKTMKYIKNKPF